MELGQSSHEGGPLHSTRNKTNRRRMIGVFSIIAFVILLGLALGLGLGLGLNHNKSTSTKPTSTSNASQTSSPSYLSTRGAFNGTSFWVVQQQTLQNLTSGAATPSEPNDGNFVMVFQHHSGQIRWMQRAYPDTWYGGTPYDVVATDARNATPIAFRGQDVFYVNEDNLLRQKHIDNVTYSWNDGPLNDLNIRVLDSPSAGLAACFYKGPIDNVNLNGTDPLTGIRLWVATDQTTFNQYVWRKGFPQWIWEERWPGMNGHATPGCFGWGLGWTTYTMFVDSGDELQLYWRDTSYTTLGTASHPVNTWMRSSTRFPKINPDAGLSFHGNLYGWPQGSGQIQGWNITFEAENSTLTTTSLSQVNGPAPIDDTKLYAFTTPAVGEARQVLVFYQTEGDDITLFTGDVVSGEWTSTKIPIPDD